MQPGDLIIASKLDRMFRSAKDALRIIEAFQKRNISLYLLDLGGNCTTDGIAKLVVTIMSAVAEFERFRTRERVQEMVAHRRREGLSLGGKHPRFGFKRVTDGLGRKTLQPVPQQQQAIKLITRLHAKKWSLRDIAHKVQKRYGVTITHMGVQGVLNREEAKAKSGQEGHAVNRRIVGGYSSILTRGAGPRCRLILRSIASSRPPPRMVDRDRSSG